MKHSTLGRHIVADLWGCCESKLSDGEWLTHLARDCIDLTGAKILGTVSHSFEPNGFTGLFLLCESHFSFHTYPEEGFIAIDCFTCGSHIWPHRAIEAFAQALQPKSIFTKELRRGDGAIGEVEGKGQ